MDIMFAHPVRVLLKLSTCWSLGQKVVQQEGKALENGKPLRGEKLWRVGCHWVGKTVDYVCCYGWNLTWKSQCDYAEFTPELINEWLNSGMKFCAFQIVVEHLLVKNSEFSLVSLKTVWKTELLCCNLLKPRQWICWFWNGFTWYVLHTLIKWCMFFLFNLLLFIYEIYQNEICKLFSCIGDSYVWNVLYDDFNWIQMLPKTLVSIMFALKGSIVVHVVIFSFIIVFNYLFSF